MSFWVRRMMSHAFGTCDIYAKFKMIKLEQGTIFKNSEIIFGNLTEKMVITSFFFTEISLKNKKNCIT